jgi:hypothetical protein
MNPVIILSQVYVKDFSIVLKQEAKGVDQDNGLPAKLKC